MHGAEMILMCGTAETQENKKHHDKRLNLFAFLSEKKTNTTIEEVDYSTFIEINRRISMQIL